MRGDPLLLDEQPLTEMFIPERMMHRDNQIKEILSHLKPALRGKDARNVLVVGNTGTGKTSLIKWMLNEYFQRNHVYVNCLNCRSEHKILENILVQLGNVIPENKPTDYLIQKFSKEVGREMIVCLDEIDQIKNDKILQTLSAQECALILISNRRYFLDSMDNRLRSRFFVAEVELQEYEKSELVDIIKDRVDYALAPRSIESDLIDTIATWSNGDARIALQTLRASAMSADSKRREEIALEDLKEAFRSARKSKREYVRSKLNEHQRFLLEVIEKRDKISSVELFESYQKSFEQPLGERAYRNQMEHLVQTGLVRELGEGRWKRFEIVD